MMHVNDACLHSFVLYAPNDVRPIKDVCACAVLCALLYVAYGQRRRQTKKHYNGVTCVLSCFVDMACSFFVVVVVLSFLFLSVRLNFFCWTLSHTNRPPSPCPESTPSRQPSLSSTSRQREPPPPEMMSAPGHVSLRMSSRISRTSLSSSPQSICRLPQSIHRMPQRIRRLPLPFCR